MPLVINKISGHAVFKAIATETLSLANCAVANVGGGPSSETVTAVHIKAVKWSGGWTVARNSVTILDLTTGGEGEWSFDDFSLTEQEGSSLVCTKTSTNGTLILELDKNTQAGDL